MNAIELKTQLQQNGYVLENTVLRDVDVYVKAVWEVPVITAVLDETTGIRLSGWQLLNMAAELKQAFHTEQVLFLAISENARETMSRLSADHSHWIYDVREGRLMIYEDQPESFFGLDKVIEKASEEFSKAARKRGMVKLLTVNNLLVLINVVIFIIMEVTGDVSDSSFLIQNGALYIRRAAPFREYYRLFTAMFLHSSIRHIGGNMLVLFVLGNSLEDIVGKIKYLLIYLLSGIIGNIVAAAYYSFKGLDVCCVGASGAIFGVVGALVYILIRNKGRFAGLSLRRIIIYLILSIYLGATTNGISLSAHLGGLVGGFLSALILYRKKEAYTYEN